MMLSLCFMLFWISSSNSANFSSDFGNSPCMDGVPCTRDRSPFPSCQPGYYCQNSGSKTPCPKGTFSPNPGAISAESCQKCPKNYFNHLYGQLACFSCGSMAVQPLEGQETCICRGEGREFQASDRQCTCGLGYQPTNVDMQQCVLQFFDICRDQSSRNQEGVCLTKEQWTDYCSLKVCSHPSDYRGYDRSLGLCLCHVQDIRAGCGADCKQTSRCVIHLICRETLQLQITYKNTKIITSLSNMKPAVNIRTIQKILQCPTLTDFSLPVYLVEVQEQGFLGILNPNPLQVLNLFQETYKWKISNEFHVSNTSDIFGNNFLKNISVHKNVTESLWAEAGGVSENYAKILNPTVCLNIGDILTFVVTKDHYPVYDINNLYNTKSKFDWGDFRSLAEEMNLMNSDLTLFLHSFQQPGVYVLKLSSNQHKKMYIRVMPPGARCYEDRPFFPSIPRHMIHLGVARIPNLPLKPDWPAIAGLMAGAIILFIMCIVLLILLREFGWTRKKPSSPKYRCLHLKYNFDDYSSRGLSVTRIKKYNRRLLGQVDAQELAGQGVRDVTVMKNDEFWDYEEQIDLETFDINLFYEILLKQSVSVTARISQMKEEVKVFYKKIVAKTELLCQIWTNLTSVPELVEQEVMENFKVKQCQINSEISRRKNMAKMFGQILNKQYQLLVEDWKYREEHQVTFNAQVREILRLLEDLSYQQVNEEIKGFQLCEENDKLSWRVGSLLTKMSDEITRECKRLKCWAVLGDGIGAYLLANGKQEILTWEDLIAPDGSLLAPDVVHIDPLTDLIFPNLDTQMILPNSHAMSVPRDYFVHPQTGKVLPIMGNVCYDPMSSRLVLTSDNTRDKARRTEEHPIPYVPFPIFHKTGLPVNCRLQALKPGMAFRFGAPMEDPASGIIVPILAITIHPHTGVVYPLGGTYLSPITNMTEVIEIGGIMIDNKTGQAVPILGVGINPHSGDIIPVGGTLSPSTSALLPGDNFVEPLSGKTVRIAGASLQRSKVIPHAGGYGSLLDTYALSCQIHVMDLLKEYKDSIMNGLTLSVEHPLSKKGTLKAALADLAQCWNSRQQLLVQTKCDLEHEEHLIQSLISSGGSQGMIKYPGTNFLCHAVIGMLYPDPEGSRMEVPLLGVHEASNTRQLIPLAGTMEDADGKGLVPISIGARTVDPVTGEVGTVVGARLDPLKNIVLPVTHSYHPLIKRKMRFELIDQVENEIGARCKYYEQQKKKEDILFQELSTSLRSCLDSVTQGKCNKTQWNRSGKSLKLTSSALLQASTTEMQRRVMQVSNMDSVVFPNVVLLLNKVDNDEGDQLLQLMNLIQELVQKVTLYFEKWDREDKRLKVQAMKQIVGVEMKSHKQTKDHLLKEIWEFVLTHQAMLDGAFSRLEYLRCLSNMYTKMAKDILTGKSYCFGDYQIIENNNNKKTQRGAQLSQTHLIPLLKQLITLLEEKNQNSLTTLAKTQPEEDYDQILSKSPLLRLLKTVNTQLRASAKAVGILETEHLSEEAAAVPADHIQENRSEFLDLLDAQLVCEGDLTSVNLDSLSAREFIVYQHGLSLLNFLESHICAPRITLLLAATLPSNQYVNNAFRNSFFFEEAKKILFIRRQCLESVGGFTLLLLHCLSHITAEDLAYDSNPVFIRLFHQALKACFSDYFFTRLQLTSSYSPHKELLRVLQNTLLCGEPCSADTRNTLSHLLHQRVDEPTKKEFFQEQTVDHMMRYKKAAACCTVENLLKEENLAKKKEYFQQSQESTTSKYNRRNSKDGQPTAINEDIQEGLACKVKEHSMLPETPPRSSTQISSSPSNPSSLPNRESLIHQIRELELECGLLSQDEVDLRSNLQLESSGELG